MFGSAYGGTGRSPASPPVDLVISCECTLDELYMGCLKKLQFERLVLGLDGKSTRKQNDEIEVEIRPGYSDGEKLTFNGNGNEGFEYPNCNILINQ